MTDQLEDKLHAFAKSSRMAGKGALSVALVVTRFTRLYGLPIDPNKLLTHSHGQVVGLNKGNVQTILAEYGIVRVLAEEGGRTSRGSIRHMQDYVTFLNALHSDGTFDPQGSKVGGLTRYGHSLPASLLRCGLMHHDRCRLPWVTFSPKLGNGSGNPRA